MATQRRSHERGFTLIEALVAMMIIALVVIQYIGVRTNALIDATQARNWRLAREIAEEKMSELAAGALEVPPESGVVIPLQKYEGFQYKVVIGEANVSELESELADSAASAEDNETADRLAWQRDREDYRRAKERGLSYTEYQEKLYEEDYARRMEENAPSETDFEEVAVVVYFPKLGAEYPDQKDSLVIKARLSTLALSGLTPRQAAAIAASKGQSSGPESAGALPGGSGAGGEK